MPGRARSTPGQPATENSPLLEPHEAINGRWPQLAKAFEDQLVLVVGDVMLDHTGAGRARRLSPEAPVPVLTLEEERYGLGGAANVARNLSSLGARVRLGGVIGEDDDGERLLELCRAASIETDAVVSVPGRRTTRKTRFVTQTHQVLRVDVETVAPLVATDERELIRRLGNGPVDAVILSDYAKGVATEGVIQAALGLARRCGAPSIVDPKGVRFERYAGCTVVTPNADEAAAATGRPVSDESDGEAAGRELLDAVGCEAVVVTHGRQGVNLVTSAGSWHLPAGARDVFDVAGAGDTLVAALTLALAAGASIPAAVALGNVAAGLVVQLRGVAVTTREELGLALAALEASGPLVRQGAETAA